MQTHKAYNNSWTKGEKLLLGAILLTVALAVLGTFWWRQRNISLNSNPNVSIPTPKMPARNAFDYFNAAASAEVQSKSVNYAVETRPPLPNQPPGSLDHIYSLQQKAALVQANAPALKMIRQGLALPYLNPPIRSFSTPMPYYIKFRGLARLLALEGQVRESQGDWEGAVNDDLDALLLGEKIPHGSVLLGSIFGIGCEGTGRRPLWRDVDHLSAAQARESARRLEQTLRAHVPFAETLQEEEWFNQASLLEIFRRPTWRTEMRSYMAGDASLLDMGVSLSAQQQAQLKFASKKAIMSDYTTGMNSLIRFARQPYSLTVPNASSNVLVLLLLGNFREFQCSSLDNESQDGLLAVAFALRAYRLEHGAYPATLASLAPAYLRKIPTDPFAASGPLHYRRHGTKYVLYSVGPDGKDDGGKPIFDASKPAPAMGERGERYIVTPDSRGDIVAGVNR